MDSPLGKLKVAELKERLEAAGLSTKGVKKDLIDRLDEYERSTQNVPAKDEPPKQQSPSPKRTRSSPSKLQHDSVMEDSVPTTTPPSSTNGTGTVAQKRKGA
jgi:hypothetical protein